MKTQIRTVHEEEYGNNESQTIGVLENYTEDFQTFSESFLYRYREDGTYIIFDTIVELCEYVIYSNSNVPRAYITEEMFDEYYDNGINGILRDKLDWVNPKE